MQSRLGSFYEAMINTVIGYVVSFIGQLIIYPAYGAHFTIMQNVHIGLWFLVLSLIRSFLIRRWFNSYIVKASERIAKATS